MYKFSGGRLIPTDTYTQNDSTETYTINGEYVSADAFRNTGVEFLLYYNYTHLSYNNSFVLAENLLENFN
jgi:hypothetical protein